MSLFKLKITPKVTENLTQDQRLSLNIIQAYTIVSVEGNTTEDIQDYDLVLDNGEKVVLHKENCEGKIPQVGDYFFINPCKPYTFLFTPDEFLDLYKEA